MKRPIIFSMTTAALAIFLTAQPGEVRAADERPEICNFADRSHVFGGSCAAERREFERDERERSYVLNTSQPGEDQSGTGTPNSPDAEDPDKDRGGKDKDRGGKDKDRGGKDKDRGKDRDRGGKDKDRGGKDKDRGKDRDRGGKDKDRGGKDRDRDRGGKDKDRGGDRDRAGKDRGGKGGKR